MLGAIIGDIIGSTREFKNTQDYNFKLFPKGSTYTDDTICTIAIADAILSRASYKDKLLEWCKRYPNPKGGYGASFAHWIDSDDPQPYYSFGNGAAMRVSPVAWAFQNATAVRAEAEKATICSHSHPEGLKGADVIAQAIFMLRTLRRPKEEVYRLLVFNYGLDYGLPGVGQWCDTCQGCVPLALDLFIASKNFNDAIRLAVSYGGDSDTLAAIVGSLAEAYYGIQEHFYKPALDLLPREMIDVICRFAEIYLPNAEYINYCKIKLQ